MFGNRYEPFDFKLKILSQKSHTNGEMSVVPGSGFKKWGFSSWSSKIRVKRLVLIDLEPLLKFNSGGGKMGSIEILNALSSILGIIFDKTGHDVSKHGFVFISIRLILNSSSIIKS